METTRMSAKNWEGKLQQRRTISGPEALRRLDQYILQQASKAIPKELRTDEGEDSDARVLGKVRSGTIVRSQDDKPSCCCSKLGNGVTVCTGV